MTQPWTRSWNACKCQVGQCRPLVGARPAEHGSAPSRVTQCSSITPRVRQGRAWGPAEARDILSPLGIQPMVSSKCRSEEVLVSEQEASCCPLGFFPPSGWPRFQAWSTQSLPVQRSAACLLGPLTGLAFPGDPSITPAKWTQKVMAPLKRQTSPRLEESEGSPLQHPVPSSHPALGTPAQPPLPPLCHAALCW